MPLPATIEECHVLIAQLVSTVSALTSQVEILKLEITQLKEKLNQNSNKLWYNYAKFIKKWIFLSWACQNKACCNETFYVIIQLVKSSIFC